MKAALIKWATIAACTVLGCAAFVAFCVGLVMAVTAIVTVFVKTTAPWFFLPLGLLLIGLAILLMAVAEQVMKRGGDAAWNAR